MFFFSKLNNYVIIIYNLLTKTLLFQNNCDCQIETKNCTKGGNFLNEMIPDCRGFTMCIQKSKNMFQAYDMLCPKDFLFHPIHRICSNATDFKCLYEDTNFNCTEMGYFINNNIIQDVPTPSFIACTPKINNEYTALLMYCPNNTVFEPITEHCNKDLRYKENNSTNSIYNITISNETKNTNKNFTTTSSSSSVTISTAISTLFTIYLLVI